MKLKLVQKYNFKNVKGRETEILDIQRHGNYASGFELWKRIFPNRPFPKNADVLRTQFHRDPETRDSVQSV